ncbi:MAG: D-alanine--D-alanine ligase family protein [Ilumatobacteraceae bacterium]
MDTTDSRINLVVIYGGQSAEHDVSCVTASHVLRAANSSRYRTIPVAISRDGQWTLPRFAELPNGGVNPELLPSRLEAIGEATTQSIVAITSLNAPTVVMPLVHGPLGEDGTLQGLLEIMGVAYVGSGVLSSALAMDKAMAKTVFAQSGIPQGKYMVLRDDALTPFALTDVASHLGLPVFVKPANMGSSVGVTKASSLDELHTAAQHAAQYDEWIVFEEGIIGRELEVAVIGNRSPRASVVGEIIPGNDFYDYEDKYVSDSATLMIPSHLTQEQSDEVRALALRAYGALRCEGMARVDFFFEEHGRGFLCNEINTIPGFTPISMYPKMWEATGLSYGDLIDELVQHAQERHARKKRNTSR